MYLYDKTRFSEEVRDSSDLSVLVQKYLIEGTGFFYKDSPEDEFVMKKEIASSLSVHVRDVVIIGSGKLGYSIKPNRELAAIFDLDDITDSEKLFQKLNSPGELSKHIKRNMKHSDKEFLRTGKVSDRDFNQKLVLLLNNLIGGKCIYDKNVFPKVSRYIKKNLLSLTSKSPIVLNRALLESEFNRELLNYTRKLIYDFKGFSEKSDIDIAVVSTKLFDDHLDNIYQFTDKYTQITKHFTTNEDFTDFSKYVLKGWLRPDKTPKNYNLFNSLDEFKKSFLRKNRRSINFGIYKSWTYFEDYHIANLESIKINLVTKGV